MQASVLLVPCLVASLLASGCASTPDVAERAGCDPNAARPINAWAPLAPGFTGTNDEVAANVAAALGLPDPTSLPDGVASKEYEAGTARLSIMRLSDQSPIVRYTGAQPTVRLVDALAALGATWDRDFAPDFSAGAAHRLQPALAERDGSVEIADAALAFEQRPEGDFTMSLQGLRAPVPVASMVDPTEARDLAEAYASCRIALEYPTLDPAPALRETTQFEPYGAWGSALTYRMEVWFTNLDPGCASVSDYVHVDVASGAIVGYVPAHCPGQDREGWSHPLA